MACDFNPIWFWNAENIKDVMDMLELSKKPIFHICSGCSSIGEYRLDRSYINSPNIINQDTRLPCNIVGDFHNLPFKDSVANTVICDPPYKYDFTNPVMINEISRILKPKGKLIFIAPWIPKAKVISHISNSLWKVGKNNPYYKIASIFYKSNGQIGDYV